MYIMLQKQSDKINYNSIYWIHTGYGKSVEREEWKKGIEKLRGLEKFIPQRDSLGEYVPPQAYFT